MSQTFKNLIFTLCCLLFPIATAQEKKIPQILYLGDSVHQSIVQAAAKELDKEVSIQYPKIGTTNDSGAALTNIDSILGTTAWDIIYFNFGIGDLFYKDPTTKEIRAMSKDAGGVHVSTPEQYEKNLNALVKRLKTTKAKLIWGNTTPMISLAAFQADHENLFDAHAEKDYNSIAARVMAKNKIPVLDLHRHVMAQFKPEDKHPHYAQYAGEMTKRGQPLHSPLVKALRFTVNNR